MSAVDRERVGFFGGSQAGWIIPLAAQQLRPPPRFQIILSGAAVSTGVEGYYSALTGDGNRPPQVRDRAEVERRVRAFDGPAGFDPAPLLAASTVPTLWILGDEDESVPTFASLEALDAIRRGGNRSHTVIHYPGVDHELRDRDGRPAPVGRDSIAWLRSIGILNGREKAAGRPARENADRHEKGRQNRSGVPGGAIGVGS